MVLALRCGRGDVWAGIEAEEPEDMYGSSMHGQWYHRRGGGNTIGTWKFVNEASDEEITDLAH